MFTGIIEEMGRVTAVNAIPNGGQETKLHAHLLVIAMLTKVYRLMEPATR